MDFYILCSFLFLKPSGIDVNGYHTLNQIINIVQIIVVGYLFQKVYRGKHFKISKLIAAELLFFIIWIFCLFVNNSSILGVLKIAINAMGFELLVEYTNKTGKLNYLINAFVYMYIVLLAANVYLMVQNYGWTSGVFNSMYDSFSYLESDNGTNGYIQGSLLFGLLYSRLKHGKFSLPLITIFILCITNEYRLWSAASIVGICLFLTYYLLEHKLNKLRFSPLIVAVSAYISITFFRIQYLFSFIIVNYLHRDVSMTGRNELWDAGLKLFKGSPIVGVGTVNFSLDNTVVQILANGGVLLLLAFCLLLFESLRNISKSDLMNNALYRDGYFVFCIVIILSIGEAWINFKGFWIILSMFVNLYYANLNSYKKNEVGIYEKNI